MTSNLTSRATFYDVTGYLIPGIVALMLSWCWWWMISPELAITYWVKAVKSLSLGQLASLIALGYIVGHLVNALSSFLFEKIVFRTLFKKAKDFAGRMAESRRDRAEENSKKLFKLSLLEVTPFDLRIWAEEHLTQSFVTGFSFLSFYGMNRTLALLSALSIPPLYAYHGWLSVLGVLMTILFVYQYLRFVRNYYDYLGATLVAGCSAQQISKSAKEDSLS